MSENLSYVDRQPNKQDNCQRLHTLALFYESLRIYL